MAPHLETRASAFVTTRGFILGKIMPPHRGHVFLCETARRLVDTLTVLVCSTDTEPIDGEWRRQRLQDALPMARVLHMHREIPQAPEDDPEFWAIWRAAIAEHHPEPIDLVFGSEPYIFRLAEELDARPRIIDPERRIFSVSGTQMRDSSDWRDTEIAPARAPENQQRLCLLGPESTGKTHLAGQLAAHFGVRVMPEYGRDYDVYHMQRGGAGKGEGWSEDDLVAIAATHIAMRDAMSAGAGRFLVEDTDIIQTTIWAEFLLGHQSERMEQMLIGASFADRYLVLTPEVDWRDDGVRYGGDDSVRNWFFSEAVARLEALNLDYEIVRGADWAERSALAIQYTEACFGGSDG